MGGHEESGPVLVSVAFGALSQRLARPRHAQDVVATHELEGNAVHVAVSRRVDVTWSRGSFVRTFSKAIRKAIQYKQGAHRRHEDCWADTCSCERALLRPWKIEDGEGRRSRLARTSAFGAPRGVNET